MHARPPHHCCSLAANISPEGGRHRCTPPAPLSAPRSAPLTDRKGITALRSKHPQLSRPHNLAALAANIRSAASPTAVPLPLHAPTPVATPSFALQMFGTEPYAQGVATGVGAVTASPWRHTRTPRSKHTELSCH